MEELITEMRQLAWMHFTDTDRGYKRIEPDIMVENRWRKLEEDFGVDPDDYLIVTPKDIDPETKFEMVKSAFEEMAGYYKGIHWHTAEGIYHAVMIFNGYVAIPISRALKEPRPYMTVTGKPVHQMQERIRSEPAWVEPVGERPYMPSMEYVYYKPD